MNTFTFKESHSSQVTCEDMFYYQGAPYCHDPLCFLGGLASIFGILCLRDVSTWGGVVESEVNDMIKQREKMTSEKWWKDCSSVQRWLKRTSDCKYFIGRNSRETGMFCFVFFFLPKSREEMHEGTRREFLNPLLILWPWWIIITMSTYSHLKRMHWDWGCLSRKASKSTENMSSSLCLFVDNNLLALYSRAKIRVSILNIFILFRNLFIFNETSIIMTVPPQ